MTTKFTVKVPVEIEEGYGVWFIPVYGGEEGPEAIVDVDGGLVRIAPDTVKVSGEALVVSPENTTMIGFPVSEFQRREDLRSPDDTHDLRSRFFETREEAEEHLRYTMERWENPEPWCVFVQT